MAKAVVSTSIGAEGLPVKDGEYFLVADDPTSFAENTLRLLGDATRRAQHEVGRGWFRDNPDDLRAVSGGNERPTMRSGRTIDGAYDRDYPSGASFTRPT